MALLMLFAALLALHLPPAVVRARAAGHRALERVAAVARPHGRARWRSAAALSRLAPRCARSSCILLWSVFWLWRSAAVSLSPQTSALTVLRSLGAAILLVDSAVVRAGILPDMQWWEAPGRRSRRATRAIPSPASEEVLSAQPELFDNGARRPRRRAARHHRSLLRRVRAVRGRGRVPQGHGARARTLRPALRHRRADRSC